MIEAVLIWWWIGSIFLGLIVGVCKGTDSLTVPMLGFGLGILMGPLGIIAMLGIDLRPGCPMCGGKLNGQPRICQHCRAKLVWEFGQPEIYRD